MLRVLGVEECLCIFRARTGVYVGSRGSDYKSRVVFESVGIAVRRRSE